MCIRDSGKGNYRKLIISEKKYYIEKKINIKKIIHTSLIDWEGMIVATLYTGGCNFRCPFCYNVDLVANPNSLTSIDEDYIFKFLNERSDFLDGICLSGGEPTIYNDLIKFLVKIKNLDMKIKLDTNGANPDSLAEIIKRGLIDYIAMDIKTCLQPEKYKDVYKRQGLQ